MIPADRISFDGQHAWWVVRKCPEPRGQQSMHTDCDTGARILDRPCDTCDGSTFADDGSMPNGCPDCIEGRHTWEIEVETGVICNRIGSNFGRSQTRRLRVSVVPGMVLPISLVEPALPCVTMEGFVIPEGERIALPSAARPDDTAAQLRWEEA